MLTYGDIKQVREIVREETKPRFDSIDQRFNSIDKALKAINRNIKNLNHFSTNFLTYPQKLLN